MGKAMDIGSKTGAATDRGAQYARSLIEASLDPLVTISAEGKITNEIAIELLHERTLDNVLKDRLSRLGTAVRHAIERMRMMEQKRRDERRLHQQLDELRRFQRLTVDRELRLQELEAEVGQLRALVGR